MGNNMIVLFGVVEELDIKFEDLEDIVCEFGIILEYVLDIGKLVIKFMKEIKVVVDIYIIVIKNV